MTTSLGLKIGSTTCVAVPGTDGGLGAAVVRGPILELAPDASPELVDRRGTGEEPGVSYEEVTYEGYGPGGIAILIETLTDNRNRTTGEVRHILTKAGGRMAEAGSVQWMFHQKGTITVPRSAADEETVLGVVLDAGADDVDMDDAEVYEITTPPQAFEAVKAALQAKGIPTTAAELAKVAQNTISLSEKDAEQALKLMEALEDNDDVQRVSSNLDITDEILARIQS